MQVPTDHDLETLYAKAKTYGMASVAASAEYLNAQKTMHYTEASKQSEVRRLGVIRDIAYRAMNEETLSVNAKFGIELCCPAPFVGWTGEVATYIDYVNKTRIDLERRLRAEANQEEIDATKVILNGLPMVELGSVKVGDILFSTVGAESWLWEIVKITHKGKRVFGKDLSSNKGEFRLRSGASGDGYMRASTGYKVIDKKFADQLVVLNNKIYYPERIV